MPPARPAALESIDVGDTKITYIPDGGATVSAAAVFPQASEALWEAHRDLFNEDGLLQLTLGGFLVEHGDQKTVIDIGFGPMGDVPFEPVGGVFTGGTFLENLRSAGVEPGDVNTVFYTHLHLDHVGWTADADGNLTFPNARHVTGAGEFEFWANNTNEDLAAVGPDPDRVQAPLKGRIEAVGDGEGIAPGITAMASPGHTPGHTSAVVSSGTARAIVLGDVLHCPLQIGDNELRIIFDVDQVTAAATRDRIGRELEGEDVSAAQVHFPNSVFGRVIQANGRRWIGGALP